MPYLPLTSVRDVIELLDWLKSKHSLSEYSERLPPHLTEEVFKGQDSAFGSQKGNGSSRTCSRWREKLVYIRNILIEEKTEL